MSTFPVKFGLIGAGGIAQAYAQAFAQSEIANLVAVADVRIEAAKAMAEGAKCQSFDSYQAMAEAVELDAVIICTPPLTHPEISIYFLERKINVLCEKPLSISAKDAVTMRAAAQKAGADAVDAVDSANPAVADGGAATDVPPEGLPTTPIAKPFEEDENEEVDETADATETALAEQKD